MNAAPVYHLAGIWSQFSGHLSSLSAWHLSIPYCDTNSLNFIKTFHPNEIIGFPVQCVNALPLKLVNSQFASLSLFLLSFCTAQTNTLSVLWFKYIPKCCQSSWNETMYLSSLVLTWLRGGWLLPSYKNCSKWVFLVNSFGKCMCNSSNPLCQCVT